MALGPGMFSVKGVVTIRLILETKIISLQPDFDNNNNIRLNARKFKFGNSPSGRNNRGSTT